MRTAKQIHASSRRNLNWKSINWKKVGKKVKGLQMRIAKAVREGMAGIFFKTFNKNVLSCYQPRALCLTERPGRLSEKPSTFGN